MVEAAVNGYLVALSLILAIGAGVAGFGSLSAAIPWFGEAMRWLGVAFLAVYGGLRFRAALRGGEALRPSEAGAASLKSVLATCLVLTWANPHVYLDTVVLIGSISAQYAPHQAVFGVAAVCASLRFFSALGFGARLLAPVFARPSAWVWLEVVVGVTMWGIAVGLALGG